MMLIYLIASMIYSVSAGHTSIYTYTRSDLQNMQAIEILRQNNEFIDSAINELENNIIANAKQGKTQYIVQFEGCDNIVRSYEGATIDRCEYIVNEIKTKFARKFPNVDVLYDDKGQYIINWD